MIFNIGVILPFVTPSKALSLPIDLLLLFVFITAWLLLQRGSMRQASLMYVVGMWLIFSVVASVSGTVHSPALLFYVALPISAAWLLGFRAALWFAAVCLLCTLAMVFLDLAGVRLPSYFPNKAVGVFSDVLYAMVMATVPAAQVLKNLKEALVASQRDVVERTRAETELRKHQEHLEEVVEQRTAQLVEARNHAEAADRAKSAFLANMSHELRTPLNAILGFSTLLREGETFEERRKDLDIINRSGEHLLALINDVLDVAKIEAGRIAVENRPCDMHRLVRDITEMMQVRAREKNLELLVEKSAGFPRTVRTDASKIRQMLTNLLGNAVKYSERGTIVLRLVDLGEDSLGRVLLRFEVEDNGIGIAREDQARVFEPFVRAEKLGYQDGTGLGLAIVRQYVDLMDGVVGLESEPGKGSRFRIELPVEREAESAPPSEPRPRVLNIKPGQPEYRVLIVEDQFENRLLLRRLLERVGFQVRVAEDGATGIEIFQAWRPHFIWMDRGLGEIDGSEVVRRIRKLEGGWNVKIAAVTASALSSRRDEMLAAGLDDFLSKPYRLEEIFDCMSRHLGVRYLYRDSASEMTTGGLEPAQLAEVDRRRGLPGH
jgi:signal transduction histidine kinase/CheY-like chemotaxis protein